MKNQIPFLLIISSIFFSLSLRAHVTSGISCPDEFIGEVIKVEEPEAPLHNLSKQKVTFSVLEMLKGSLSSEVVMKALKYGRTNFLEGKRYYVSTRKGKFCAVEEIKSNS